MRTLRALSLSMLAAASAQPASATFYKATYTGLVRTGSDTTGIFGPANGDLTNLPFSATFLINDSASGAHNDFGAESSQIRSGYLYPGSAEAVSADLTISGISVHFSGATDSWAYQENGYNPPSAFGLDDIYDMATNVTFDLSGWDNSYIQASNYKFGNIVDSADLRTPGEYDVSALDSTGVFGISRQVTGGSYQGAFGNLGTTHISISAVATNPGGGDSSGGGGGVPGVPEPANWALLLTGFGFSGGALRLRRCRSRKFAPV